jgi:hypothetical protein
VDTVVLALLRSPRDDLVGEIGARADGADLHVLGDALVPRATAEVLFEGERIARTL